MKEKSPYRVSIHLSEKHGENGVLAYVGVTVNSLFAIRGIRVLKGKEGPFVAMPRMRTGKGWQDICYPCTKESRAAFDAAVLGAYDQALQEQQKNITKALSSPEMAV